VTDPKPSRIVNESYKVYILSHSCLVCPSRDVDGDHLVARGRGSASQNDYSLIPLCRQHHAERHQIGDAKFQVRYTVNLWREAWRLLSAWIVKHHRYQPDANLDCNECGQGINDAYHVEF
jgi:hypothetical protein